jgi:ABC-2 type transport system permease protein
MSAQHSTDTAMTSAPLGGVAPNLANAIGGIWRISYHRVFAGKQLLSLFWTTLVLAGITFASTRTGNETQFYEWTMRVYFMMVIPILSFMSGAGAIRDDMKPGAVDYLLTRPVRRTAFVGARFVSHLLCTHITLLVLFAAVMAIGVMRGVDNLASTWPTLWLAQVIAATGFMALGFFFGAMSSRYLIIGINYAAIIEVGLGQIPISLNNLSVLRHVKTLLAPFTSDGAALALAPSSAVTSVAFVAMLSVIWVVGAALLFSVQEFAGQKPKEN